MSANRFEEKTFDGSGQATRRSISSIQQLLVQSQTNISLQLVDSPRTVNSSATTDAKDDSLLGNQSPDCYILLPEGGDAKYPISPPRDTRVQNALDVKLNISRANQLSATIMQLKREDKELEGKLSQLILEKEKVTTDITALKNLQQEKKICIARLERIKEKKETPARAELKRLIEAQKLLLEGVSIIKLGLRKEKIPSRGFHTLLFLGMLGIGLHMILSNRRFDSLFSELPQNSYTFDCNRAPFWGPSYTGGSTCDTRVNPNWIYNGKSQADVVQNSGCADLGVHFGACEGNSIDGYPANVVDPCAPLINDLCSFNSGVIGDQLTYYLVLGLGGEGLLLLVLALSYFRDYCRSCDTKCGQLSESSAVRLQDISAELGLNIPLRSHGIPFNVNQADLEGFQASLLIVNRQIEELNHQEKCRLAVIVASRKTQDSKQAPIKMLFYGNPLSEPKLLHTIFELAKIKETKTTPDKVRSPGSSSSSPRV